MIESPRTPLSVLRQVFGYDRFRGEQATIIDTVLAGRDALVIMPTGGGKSLCYQVPSLLREGVGVIVTPLIALMQDQVTALTDLGVRAAFLNSSQSGEESAAVIRRLRAADLDLLYVAPERLLMSSTLRLLGEVPVSLFAIDEAHCVSQWGHDFRPEYRKLTALAEQFPGVPRIALTATADGRTQDDIVSNLGLTQPRRFVAGFDRPNIQYRIHGGAQGREKLARFLADEHPRDAGIVYCLSRARTEQVAAWLGQQGRTAIAYHAGMGSAERAACQDRFLREDGLIVVATIAFGMGIDKPDVRFVAHLNLPKSIEAYYQETGRAGRDGEPATAWMNYDLSDVVKLRQWIEGSGAPEEQKRIERQKLEALLGLCESTACRRQALLEYFGEALPEPCGNCDNCLQPPETYDGTEVAQKALSCVYRTGQRFGVSHLVDVLRGADNEKVRQYRHEELSTYGIGRDLEVRQWRSVFRQLVTLGHLVSDQEAYGALRLTEKARAVLRGETTLRMRREIEPRSVRPARRPGATNLDRADQPLFDALREKRKQLAAAQGVPPYTVFHDRSLYEMAGRRPENLDGFAEISGVGASKLKKYGSEFLAVIAAHPRAGIDRPSETEAETP